MQKQISPNLKKTPLWVRAWRLFFILLFVFVVGFVGSSFVTPTQLAWYHQLPLSVLTPPDWLFGAMWSFLYFLMAIAAFLVWEKASPRYFALQLICTALWPFVFFYLHSIIGGIIVILALLLFVGLTIKSFYKANVIAAVLMVPTFLWGLFALYLNSSILF